VPRPAELQPLVDCFTMVLAREALLLGSGSDWSALTSMLKSMRVWVRSAGWAPIT